MTARRRRRRLRGEGGRDGLLLTTSCGAGEAEADRVSRPDTPLPPGLSPPGAGRAHAAPHLPDARRGPAGPSPDSEGGGAGRGRQRAAHGPTAGPAHPTPSPHHGGGGVLLCPRALAVATAATAHSGGAAAGGSGTPRLPLGSLEKAFSPRAHRPSPGPSHLRAHGGAPRAAGPQLGGRGLRSREADHHTGACARSGPERSPHPASLQGLLHQGLRDEGNGHGLSLPPRPPAHPRESHSRDTRHRGGDPRGTPG